MNGCVYRTTDNKCEFYSDYGKGIVSYCDFDDCEDKEASNADRIRQMSNEELAEWIESIEPAACPWRDDHGENCRFTHCRECWISWLKSPTSKEGEG